jgi:long-chain acyl-CoA synthetase
MDTISIQQAFSGKHILVTGASGFLGKVWLTMLLDRIPSVGRVYVLIRKKGLRPALARFEKMVGSIHAFKPLHEKYGADLGSYLGERVEVLEGDISLPNFGIEGSTLERLKCDLDLVVQVAGLVDFSPDIRDSMSTNVEGAINAADLVESCDHAKLLHVSTCYVTGNRDGLIEETLADGIAPNGEPFDVMAQIAALKSEIADLEASLDTPEACEETKQRALNRIRDRGLDESNETLVRNMAHRERGRYLKKQMIKLGVDWAVKWGWSNTYTFTKSLAERVLAVRNGSLQWTSFRPAIVESALSYPLPGWNEGFNTCGPLVFMLERWLRHLPAKGENPFDVIPVDLVCNAMFITGAELLLDCHKPVYQCGSSQLNQLNFRRATDLTSLGTRRRFRAQGESAVERLILSRWDPVLASPDHWLSTKNLGAAAKGFGKLLRHLPGKIPPGIRKQAERLADGADSAARQFEQVHEVFELFRPFIYDNHFVFACEALLEREVEEEEFRFDPSIIDWRHYWLDIHMPGIRRWCFPIIEGKQPESFLSETPFQLQPPVGISAPPAEQRAVGQGEGV